MDLFLNEKFRLGVLICGMFVLCAVELLVPLRRRDYEHGPANLLLTGTLILVNLACSTGIVSLSEWSEAHNFGFFRLIPTNYFVQLFVGILFLDFWSAYLSHVLFHKISWLWRFHSVHHSDKMVDVTTAFRQHPVESLLRIAFYVSGMILLGIPLWILMGYLTLSAINAQLEHANVRLGRGTDRLLQYFYVTPNMHKVHHSKFLHETDSNYSNIFSLWDRLFGTYRPRNSYDDVQYGIDYLGDRKRSFWDLIRLPFREKKNHP